MTEVIVDYWRQLDLFTPEKFKEEVHFIGVGATGSYAAFLTAKLGVKNIHVWDFDNVEPHNLPNQLFRLKDSGKPKVDALAEIILEATGIKITTHNAVVTGDTPLRGIVFLLTDTMESRKAIWEGALKFKLAVKLMVETRMAIDNGRIYSIRPSNPGDIKLWEGTLYSDDEAEESACSNRSIGPTVAYLASLAVWKLIKWHKEEDMERELIICARPATIITG